MTSTSAPPATWRGPLLIAAAAALWGTTGVAAKTLFDHSAVLPQSLAFLRLAIACPCFLLLSRLNGEAPLRQLKRNQWLWLGLLGLTQGAYQATYLGAVHLAGAGLATLVALCLAPVLVAIAAVPLLGERLTLKVVTALIGAVFGTWLLVHGDHPAGAMAHRLWGIGLALVAAVVYASFTLLSRHLAGGLAPFQTAFVCFLTGGLTLLPGFLTHNQPMALAAINGWQYLIIAYVGLITTCVAYICFFQGMRTTGATASSIIVTLEPLFAAMLAWIVLDERLGGPGIAGAVILTLAVLAASSSGARRRARKGISPPGRS